MAYERVASLDDVKVGEALQVTCGGEPMCVVRVANDTVKVVHDVCSHQQWSLSDGGWVEDDTIECSLHGSAFDLDTGLPTCLPAVTPVPTYAVRVEDGAIEIDPESTTNDAPVPDHF